VSAYHVQFRARAGEPLQDDVLESLARALDELPGARSSGAPGRSGDILEGAFVIDVPSGKMSDASRDGGRLAKESLNSAGVDAQLIELSVRLEGP
jgi:hypothetical protein